MPLASCVVVGELYTFSELCGRWQAIYRWRVVRPLASCVAVGELGSHWLAVWSLASWVAVSDLRTFSELCGNEQAIYR